MRTTAVEPTERDLLLDRLTNLRTILPVLAEELASSRRQLGQLRRENRRLRERLSHLERVAGRGAPTPRQVERVALTLRAF
ncbi:MAG TPA: hypothetical protein VN618_04165 [Solirubrobacteraceae bacterium]|nr:hypothetical protein [Solirubrobacteraceae bacterium]